MASARGGRLPVGLKWGLGAICAYELGALTGLAPWPTITHLVHTHRAQKPCKVLVWAGLGGLAWHLLVEESR